MLGLMGLRGKAGLKSARHERAVRKPSASLRRCRRRVGGLGEVDALEVLDRAGLDGVCEKS